MSSTSRTGTYADRASRERGLTLWDGMSVDALQQRLSCSEGEAKDALQALQQQGLLEIVDESFRLVPRLRSPKVLYGRVAALVEPGEWTTYADLADAATGSTDGKQAVGRAAALDPAFPNPHRVLLLPGKVPQGWRDADGRGRDYCRSLLESEGVLFGVDKIADQSQRVNAHELRDRWDSDPFRVPAPALPTA